MKTERKINTIWNNVGAFIAFSMFSAISFAMISPAPNTSAADTLTTKTNAVVNGVISVTAPADSDYAFGTITPTDSGTFASKTGTVSVKTNNITGYKLYISTNTSEVRMTADGSDTYINSCAANVSSSSMAANTWGYSTDGTTFNPITASNVQIGQQASPLTKTSAYTHSVTIGMKVSNTLKAGTYSNVVKFTAITN